MIGSKKVIQLVSTIKLYRKCVDIVIEHPDMHKESQKANTSNGNEKIS